MVRAQIIWVARDDQFEQADRVGIVKDEGVIGVLERPLHLLYVVSTAAYVNILVLRVFHA